MHWILIIDLYQSILCMWFSLSDLDWWKCIDNHNSARHFLVWATKNRLPSNRGSFLEYRPVICILDPSSSEISKVILDSIEGILLTSQVLEVCEEGCSFCVVASRWKDRRIPDSQSKFETAVVFKPYRMHFINNNYFIWTIDLCSIYAPFWISLRMPSIDTLLLWLSPMQLSPFSLNYPRAFFCVRVGYVL